MTDTVKNIDEERAGRTAAGVAYVHRHFGVDLHEDDLREAQAWRATISAGHVGRRM